ncbi:MAG TPA: multiheme c-type cytochrome [Nannocystaceae bacterium]|nr:multiheme c-type cytochrome [Nannocystaceae bacterium]
MRWLVLAAIVGCSAADAQPRALDPSPEACATCHEDVANEWRTSMHARAWTDPVFRAEYDARPAESCRGCHAPASSAPARSTGIDCASCHVQGGEVLATTISDEGQRAHAMRLAPALRDETACAGCHQFDFTDDGVHDPNEALQNTVVEHRGSTAFARGETCTSCHMRKGGGHAFAGIHDPEQLARAVEVELIATRSAGTIDVDVRVRGAKIGHAFPTGDVFRSGVLRVCTSAAHCEEIVMQRWLARTIDPDRGGFHVRTVEDTRVPPPGQGELVEALQLPDDGSDALAWDLSLHRLPRERAIAAGLAPDLVTRRVAHGRARVTLPTGGGHAAGDRGVVARGL